MDEKSAPSIDGESAPSTDEKSAPLRDEKSAPSKDGEPASLKDLIGLMREMKDASGQPSLISLLTTHTSPFRQIAQGNDGDLKGDE
jgi:hypothetical protein